jgi:diguanylate cyclase (GGDEF)-like protein/PAS domain S-box-containing protein
MIEFLAEWMGCENVGIRVIREDGMAPYVVYKGYDADFITAESCVSIDEDDCVCLRVLRQQFTIEDIPKVSETGSYYSSQFTQFVSTLNPRQLKRFRGVCAANKYQSMAVIPLSHHEQVMGAIHLADRQNDMFSSEGIQFVEAIGSLMAEAIHQHHLEQAIEKSAYNQSIINGLFDGTNALAYVADPNNYQILYASRALNTLYGKDLADEVCYKALYNLEGPCEFCHQQENEEGETTSLKEVFNPYLNKHMLLSDKRILWPDGRWVRFQFSVDISERYRAEEMVIRKLKFEEGLASITARFNGLTHFKVASEQSLQDIRRLFKAEYVCLYLGENLTKYVSTLGESEDAMDYHLSPALLEQLMDEWNKGSILCKKSGEQEFREVSNYLSDILDTSSMITLPLNIKGSLLGVLAIKNISTGGQPLKEIVNPLKLVGETLANAAEREKINRKLVLSEERYRAIFDNSGSAVIIIDENLRLILSNYEAQMLFNMRKEELETKSSLTDFLPEDEVNRIKEYNRRRIREIDVPRQYEARIKDRTGIIKNVIISAVVLPQTTQTVLSIIDITERKRIEEKFKFLSFHDQLTQLYNRVYFEQELRKTQEGQSIGIGLIMCDVNGLKLINTTFGNEEGDRVLVNTASLLKTHFKDYLVARIGGDEFAVLIDNCFRSDLESICNQLRQAIEKYNANNNDGMYLDLSIGYAYSETFALNSAELLKNADNVMSREKLHSSNSTRNSQVQILTKALEVRDFITEGHAERVHDSIETTGRRVGLSEHQISDLRLFAQFHDIGKVGIPDQILFKNGRLSGEEWAIMRTHCEIGYRIAHSAPDLHPIADWILKHHENWDGSGYPLKLSREEIPIECRILAVADAFDAMTNDRPYRKALPIDAAIEEISRCAGTQFDPYIVEIFTESVEALA